jgi:hypothetical protein
MPWMHQNRSIETLTDSFTLQAGEAGELTDYSQLSELLEQHRTAQSAVKPVFERTFPGPIGASLLPLEMRRCR